MSYDIIKRIKVTDGKVIVASAANNVRPHYYTEYKCDSLTKILSEQGKDALELEIFRHFENGTFQGRIQKYQRALQVLRNDPKYPSFNWRVGGKAYAQVSKNRDTVAFDELLKKALKTQLPKDKFIITKGYCGDCVFLLKLTKRGCKWTKEKIKAKIFVYEAEASRVKGLFIGSDRWAVERVV
jgi:hypothetical protein